MNARQSDSRCLLTLPIQHRPMMPVTERDQGLVDMSPVRDKLRTRLDKAVNPGDYARLAVVRNLLKPNTFNSSTFNFSSHHNANLLVSGLAVAIVPTDIGLIDFDPPR